LKKSILRGALLGLFAWLAYGIVEFVLALVFPRLWAPESRLLSWQWPIIGILFAAYASWGLLLGAAGGMLLAWSGRAHFQEGHRAVASLILTLTFAANLVYAWPLARSEEIALAVAAVLGVMFCLAFSSDRWHRRTVFLTNPWVVSLLLLCGPWISREALHEQSALVKTAVSLIALGALAGIAALWHRLRSERPIVMRRKAATVVAVSAVFWGLAEMSSTGTKARANQAPSQSTPGTPNILLITMDTVRADHLSVYGYERDTTPYLRKFAGGATVYTNAVAASDMTLPSHASIFTGLYPSWHGAYAAAPDFVYGRPLPSTAVTLAEMLRAKGYWTAAVVANHSFLQTPMGLAQGFAVWKHNMPMHLSTSDRPFYLREGARNLLSMTMSTAAFDGYFLRASDITRDAIAMLEPARNHGAFFLFLNYMDAHIPLVPPPPFRDRFPGRDPNFRPAKRHQDLTNATNAGRGHLTEAEKRHLISQYDGGIAYVDAEIGKLLMRLREMNLYENTLIIITSDHGEAFGDHDRMQHAVGSVYQEEVHIPILIKYPGQYDARRADALVNHVDLMPTTLKVAGCQVPAQLHGRILTASGNQSTEPVFSEAWALGDLQLTPRLRGVRRAVFTRSSKLITSSGQNPEFYNLATDPGETRNRYRADDPVAASLLARLTAWTAAIPSQPGKPARLEKSTMERIKSLGYVQ
jgi:arylsulfatase A-like enzyme